MVAMDWSLFPKDLDEEPMIYTHATFGTVYNAGSHGAYTSTVAGALLPEVCNAFFKSRTWATGNHNEQSKPVKAAIYTRDPLNINSHIDSQAIYRDLCSHEDPPRSVAICPQRRCVAFGCRQGVELHWVDALSGQNLRRWFPLSVPSDYLFFMPARAFVDNARRLRLISSGEYVDGAMKSTHSSNEHGSSERDIAEVNPERQDPDARSLSTMAGNDFRGAIPLSDGYHLLIVLTRSGDLCLAKENARGQSTRALTKRFVFVGPRNESGNTTVPFVYVAAPELRWGIRVAAAYNDRLWMFNVPPDLFMERGKVEGPSDNDVDDLPVQIFGAEVASIAHLATLALDGSAGDLTLWAFASNARLFVFQLAGSGFKAVTQREATSDGIIALIQDTDGDTVMTDALLPPVDGSVQSDGITSHMCNWPCSSVPCFSSCNHNYCNRLLEIACYSMLTDAKDTPTACSVRFRANTKYYNLHSPIEPCSSACRYRQCNLLPLSAENAKRRQCC